MSNYKFGYNLPSNSVYHEHQADLTNCVITADSLEELKSQAEIKGLNIESFKSSVQTFCQKWDNCKVAVKPWKYSVIGELYIDDEGYPTSKFQSSDFVATHIKDLLNLSDPYASWKTKEIKKGDKVYLHPKAGILPEMTVLDYSDKSEIATVLIDMNGGLIKVKAEVKRSNLIPYFED